MKKARYLSDYYNYDSIFAERLRHLMRHTSTTQAQLAEHIETTRQAISQYMNGTIQPNAEKLRKIAEYFDVTSDYLIGLTDNQTHETAAIGEITGLSDKAIAALWYFKLIRDTGFILDNDILPLVNFLLASELDKGAADALYEIFNAYTKESKGECICKKSETLRCGDNGYYNFKYDSNAIYNDNDKILLDKNILDRFKELCADKNSTGRSVLRELYKYFNANVNTSFNDDYIYLTDKNELCLNWEELREKKGKQGTRYLQNELIEQMLVSNILKSLQRYRQEWQEQNDTEESENFDI